MSSTHFGTRTYSIPRILPWLHIFGAAFVVIFSGLSSAVHSPLGLQISAGESAGFAWIGANITSLMGCVLVYLILVCRLQIKQLQPFLQASKTLPLLICIEVVAIACVAPLIYFQRTQYLAPTLTALMLCLLLQALYILWRSDPSDDQRRSVISPHYSTSKGLFLVLLFAIGAAISILDPSWRRLSDQVFLDSDWAYKLRYLYPPMLSAVNTVWFGIGMMAIVFGLQRLQDRLGTRQGHIRIFNFVTFFSLSAALAAVLLVTLYYAIPWQINNLNLAYFIWQLFAFLSTVGGILFAAIFHRIPPQIADYRESSLSGTLALTLGAAILLPIAWLLAFRRNKLGWRLLPILNLGLCVFIGYIVLFGDFFNPWFTAYSYFKGAILNIISVVAAGSLVLIIRQLLPGPSGHPSSIRQSMLTLMLIGVLGFIPFYALGKFPEVKAAVLQYNEIARVNAAFAREITHALGLDKWFRLGQRPPQNDSPHPWPLPWRLEKTHPSLLPENFNMLVIVVDALRGDAFHSAGYHRNLTPFLDRWAREEGLSFRRAYSQGGGSFAAYPFLVAGRSRLDLYGPDLHQQNLYFKIARAEGIQQYMLMKGIGPRDIFPPELAVTELDVDRAVSDRRSVTADEVFDAARQAIGLLTPGERFLCFLTLMDVHNDLWKKEGGTDFGDTPRDLYDNNLSYLDKAFGRFIAWLKTEGIYDRTVILFASDHGEQFWEHGASLHGHTVYEEEIRIPLILVSHAIHMRFEDVPVIAADIAPTIADLAGYSVNPPYNDPRMGISLVPLIRGNETERYLNRDVIGRASFKRRYFLYRNWEWKLIYLAELDVLQLFNVVTDPNERVNLLAEKPDVAAKLEQELLEYLNIVEGKSYRRHFSQ
jgi:hypothetical protein